MLACSFFAPACRKGAAAGRLPGWPIWDCCPALLSSQLGTSFPPCLPADDHTCDTYIVPETQEEIIGYVPQVFNATRVSVPAWVYTAQPAKQ
jgi:hypothetical protein